MYGIAFLAIIGGGVMIWISSRNNSQQIRQIGLGLIVMGFIIFALTRFNVEIFPST